MGLRSTLVTPVGSVLFISASHEAGRSVRHYSVSGEKRELVWKTQRDSQFAPTVSLRRKSDLVPPNKAHIFVVASCLFICKRKTKRLNSAVQIKIDFSCGDHSYCSHRPFRIISSCASNISHNNNRSHSVQNCTASHCTKMHFIPRHSCMF